MNDAFRERVRTFVDVHVRPHVDEWEARGAYPESLMQQAGDAGLLSLGHSTAALPCDRSRLPVLVEELTRSGAQGITMGLGAHFVSLEAVAIAAPDIAEDIIPEVLSGRCSISLAITEPQAGSDLKALEATAEPDGTDVRITGRKTYICNGTRADYLLVVARQAGRTGLYLVEGNAPGLHAEALSPLGWRCLPLADLRFDGVPGIPLGGTRGVGRLLQQVLARERLTLAVMAVTSAEDALEITIERCRQRQVQGESLFAKQVPRHRLAEHAADVDVARVYVDHCVAAFHRGDAPARRIATAKNAAVGALQRLAPQALHLHGAAGCVAPALVERIYRDSALLALGGGSTEMMNELIAQSLESRE